MVWLIAFIFCVSFRCLAGVYHPYYPVGDELPLEWPFHALNGKLEDDELPLEWPFHALWSGPVKLRTSYDQLPRPFSSWARPFA